MFNTKNAQAPVAISPYMELGDQFATIKSIELKEARSGSKQVIFQMETDPVEVAGFKPVDDAKGKVGRVQASIYLKDDSAKMAWVTERVLPIAIELGVREQMDAIEKPTFEEYVVEVEKLLKDKRLKWLIGGEEYVNQNGDVRVKLRLPRYNFIGDTVKPFDKTDKYHYSPYVAQGAYMGSGAGAAAADDLPF